MSDMINTEDVRKRARGRLPRFLFDLVDGGAEDEITMRANRAGFQKVTFRSRQFVDVSKRDLGSSVLGEKVAMPVLLAPAGTAKIMCRDGDLAAARAAGRGGTIFTLSATAGYTLEEVTAEASGPLWFQICLWRRRDVVTALVERAQLAGYKALVVTMDAMTGGKRERELRAGLLTTSPSARMLTFSPAATISKVIGAANRPLWVRDFVFGSRVKFMKNFIGLEATRGMSGAELLDFYSKELISQSTTWDDLAWLRKLWKGPLVVKSIMTSEVARQAVDFGADGIVVSNHGGRQLDGLPATIEVLPEIVDAVGGRAEVFVDGGIRRGADVVKAIALGARACLIGRPYLFGLAAGGESGVVEVLQILRSEIDRTLMLLGYPVLAEVDRAAVQFGR